MYLFARLADRARVRDRARRHVGQRGRGDRRLPPRRARRLLAVVPALLPDAEIERRLAAADAAAIVKLGRHFSRVAALLARLGLAADARYVERAGLACERSLGLAGLALAEAPYFFADPAARRGAAWC
jgi:precorrin-2/cobalt-factor-2 C20-methyltransferase